MRRRFESGRHHAKSPRCLLAACRILTPCGEGSIPSGLTRFRESRRAYVRVHCDDCYSSFRRFESFPTATQLILNGERDSFVTRRGGFDSRGQLHGMARVLLVRRSGFHPGSAGIVTPARHPGSLAVLVKAAA